MSDTTPTLNRRLRVKPSDENDAFRTPTMKRVKLKHQSLTPGASPAFEIPPSPCLKRLGYGTGIKVLLYERSPRSNGPRSPWAIKKFANGTSRDSKQIASRLEHEAKIMKTFDHPNIIGYRGFKINADGSRVLALETGKKCCSLYDWIEEVRDDETTEAMEPMPAEKIAFVVREVAKGLDYLHKQKRILHGDLKAANVLIIGEFDAVKLCDFGVTVPLQKDGTTDPTCQYVGTEPWSAPEVIEEEEITDKADIFALGCTIFEMLALDTPHADKLPPLDASIEETKDASYDTSDYQDAMGSRPNLPDYFAFDKSYENILSIFYACTDEDPEKRPSAEKLVEILGLGTTTKESKKENAPDN